MHITTTSQPPPPTRHHHHCYHHNYHQRVLVRACACTACYSRAVTPALRPVRAFGGGHVHTLGCDEGGGHVVTYVHARVHASDK